MVLWVKSWLRVEASGKVQKLPQGNFHAGCRDKGLPPLRREARFTVKPASNTRLDDLPSDSGIQGTTAAHEADLRQLKDPLSLRPEAITFKEKFRHEEIEDFDGVDEKRRSLCVYR